MVLKKHIAYIALFLLFLLPAIGFSADNQEQEPFNINKLSTLMTLTTFT